MTSIQGTISVLAVSILFACLAPVASAQGPYAAAAPAPAAQDPYMAGLEGPTAHITIEPVLPIGPAIDSGEGGMYGGLGFSGGYNFMRRSSINIGIDGQIIFAVPIVKTWDSYYDHSGTWLQLSPGFPMRFGNRISFFFRPGLCFEVFDHHVEGYDPGINETWEVDFDSSVAFGICLGFGMDININDRMAIGWAFNMDILPLMHYGESNWYTGTVPVTNHYGDEYGFLSIMMLWRVIIKI